VITRVAPGDAARVVLPAQRLRLISAGQFHDPAPVAGYYDTAGHELAKVPVHFTPPYPACCATHTAGC
jgi:hypothetical protein